MYDSQGPRKRGLPLLEIDLFKFVDEFFYAARNETIFNDDRL